METQLCSLKSVSRAVIHTDMELGLLGRGQQIAFNLLFALTSEIDVPCGPERE